MPIKSGKKKIYHFHKFEREGSDIPFLLFLISYSFFPPNWKGKNLGGFFFDNPVRFFSSPANSEGSGMRGCNHSMETHLPAPFSRNNKMEEKKEMNKDAKGKLGQRDVQTL